MKLSAMRKETQLGVYTGVFYSEYSTDSLRLFSLHYSTKKKVVTYNIQFEFLKFWTTTKAVITLLNSLENSSQVSIFLCDVTQCLLTENITKEKSL